MGRDMEGRLRKEDPPILDRAKAGDENKKIVMVNTNRFNFFLVGTRFRNFLERRVLSVVLSGMRSSPLFESLSE
jgi:hypothetical protein